MSPTRTASLKQQRAPASDTLNPIIPNDSSISSSMSHPSHPDSPTHTPLFPASSSHRPPRPSHHKKRPASHIPRPPNAFILFRTNFIHERHLHSSNAGPLSNVSPTALSTIAGITWRNMPEAERQIWVEKARLAREEHRKRYPSYRYQPVPTAEERSHLRETKRKVKEENLSKPDVRRCEEISRLLCMGIKGEELERRIAQFDLQRQASSGSAAAPPPTRSTSLPSMPSPPPQASSLRQRSYSTSDAAYSTSGADAEYESMPDTPELFPAPGTSQSYEMLSSVAEHALPELAYDSASPVSVNLPDPQEPGYLLSGPSSYADFNLHSQDTSQPLPTTSHPMTTSHPHTVRDTPNEQSYHQSVSSLTTWEPGPPTNDPAYLHFPYFASGRYGANTPHNVNASIMIPYDANMPSNITHPNAAGPNDTTLPYATSISPSALHRKLKSFEQPLLYELPETEFGLYAFSGGEPSIDLIF